MSSDLGSFLRTRRARITPSGVGMAYSGFRRAPGLRREEIAVLAGVSSDYYTKLEQGREHHPSAQILDALARTMELSDDERGHLYRLADLVPQPPGGNRSTVVDPQLLTMMDAWSATPAMVISATLDVLARNHLARAMYSGFTLDDNLLRMTFLDPEGARFYRDWDRAAEASVANLRAASAALRDTPQVRDLITELTAASPAFADLWKRQEVRGKSHEAKSFCHPDVGTFTLTYLAFDVRNAPGQQLIVYQAEPGTPDAHALLGAITAPTHNNAATSS